MNVPLIGEEGSRSQRSMSASFLSSQEMIDLSLSTSYDSIFPLFDEMSRIAPQNRHFARIVMFIIFVQQIISSACYLDFGSWNSSNVGAKIIRYITYVADFGVGDSKVFNSGIPQAIVIIISLFTFIWTFCMLLVYHLNKSFDKGAIILTRFLISTLNHVILIPIFFSLSFEFNAVFDGDFTGTQVVLLVFLILAAISSSMLYYIDIIFRSSTAYLENTIFVQWDGTLFILTTLLTCGLIFVSRMLVFFNTWTKYALVAVTGILLLLILFFSLGLPFINCNMNGFFQGMLLQMFMNVIITLIPFNNYVKFVLCLVPFIIFTIIFIQLDKKFRKFILTKRPMETEARELLILMIAIQDSPEEFIQWQLLRDITTAHPTTTTFVRIAQFLSFFPSESQLLNHYVSIINKHSDLSFSQRYLFYQIKRIHILRQSSATRQSNYDFAEVQKATNKMSQAISGFFLRAMENNQELSIDALSGFYSANQKTLGICLEAMDKYPNSIRLAYEFSRYLIECRTDFQEGANWFYRAESMERGSNVAIDYAFRSMVNLFPVYIKNNLLDYRGKKVVNFKSGNGSNSSSSASSSQSLAIMLEDCDEEQASRVFSKPKLRFALRRAIDNVTSRSLVSLQVAIIAKMIAVVVASIIMFVVSFFLFKSRSNMCGLISNMAQSFESYCVGFLSVSKLWALSIGIAPSPEVIKATVGVDPRTETSSIGDGIKMINEMGQSLANLAKNDFKLIELSKDFILSGAITYCNDNGSAVNQGNLPERGDIGYVYRQMLRTTSFIGEIMKCVKQF
ncbi:hypothetical protein TVAG_411250 [Trichomonas vaginalis G3]|uniref:Uncharacterized protein n=1 Tax=Trichomonas vaginalis (strain ATCC PRA-98 / G3) TaxID=412133 RepID=A2DXN0_TRIV3|nr:guanylate cyclase protein [Trichomonas vaginalis G3]EAY14859.1 hypothetical protein TVAG_411250 [Trichomonas vaginalis G3]KAI5541160.1 guanylate cyclase protein [Trichomonas vaginalis G3]|eukprot:XP_001327082.1 hypothetical protein [Trichomonas vaginalis G3]